MKRLTTLGVALLAATALTAALATASASAVTGWTVLCTKAETTCAPGNIMPAESYYNYYVAPNVDSHFWLEIKNTGEGLSCEQAVFGNLTKAKEGLPLKATALNSMDESGCSWGALTAFRPKHNCTGVTMSSGSSELYNGAVSFGNSKEPFTVSFSCTVGTTTRTCIYKAPNAGGYWATVTHEAEERHDTVTARERMLLLSGTGCTQSELYFDLRAKTNYTNLDVYLARS